MDYFNDFVPIHYAHQLASHTFNLDAETLKLNREMNPWNDPDLAYLQFMRFNVLREIHLRDPDMRFLYWNQIAQAEALLIEGECVGLMDLYYRILEVEHDLIRERYLQADIKELDKLVSAIADPAVAKLYGRIISIDALIKAGNERIDMEAHALSSFDKQRLQIRLNLLNSLVPSTYPAVANYNQNLIQPWSADYEKFTFEGKGRAEVNNWRDHLSRIQSEISMSARLLIQRLAVVGAAVNPLKPPYGKNHVLFTNSNIPAPTLTTFPAWFSLAGLVFRGITRREREAWTGLCRFTPQYILTFQIPCLAGTKEHMAGGFDSDSSGADHSLSARNANHLKTESGGILLGPSRVVTLILGRMGERHLVARHEVRDSTQSGLAIHLAHMDMVPGSVDSEDIMRGRFSTSVFTPLQGIHHSSDVTGFLFDPWLSYPSHQLPFQWIFTRLPLDTPWRSMARFAGALFRLDDLAEAAKWELAFIEAAQAWIATPHQARMQLYSKDVFDNLQVSVRASLETRATGSGGKTFYDLSILKGIQL